MVTIGVFIDRDGKFLGTEILDQARTTHKWCGHNFELMAIVENGRVARYRQEEAK